MNKTLVDEFFERDLSDEEMQALKESLDPEEALRFAEKARELHRGLGLGARLRAELQALGARLASFADQVVVARAVTVAAGLLLLFAGAAVVAYKVLQAQDVFVMAPVAAAAPGASTTTTPPALRGAGQTVPAQATRQLVIHLTLKEAALVETLVRRADGTLVCSLGNLVVEAGDHRLVWNGRAPDGSVLPAGRYQVVTHWDGQEIIRWVELQPGHA
jgi:hypothetical protein